MLANYDTCIIESDSKNLTQVEFFLMNFFRNNFLPEDIFYKVYLCISEAVINSIFHGNKGDNGKLVTIKIKLKGNNLLISVCDEGNGFNYLQLEDPTKNENVRKEFGRGVHIIKSFTYSLLYRKNCCFIKFKI